MAQFEGQERREKKILAVLKEYGISSIDECKEITLAKGIDVDNIVRSTQPICFENAVWAYTVGAAIAIKKGCTKAADASAAIGIGLQSFCIPGRCREPQGRSRSRQSRQNAFVGRNRLLLLPRRA